MLRSGMALKRTCKIFLAFWLLFCAPLYAAEIVDVRQEIELGGKIAVGLEKQYGLVHNEVINRRVTGIGLRLAAVCERPDLPFSFKVLASRQVNAIACPDGQIYLFKGLVDRMPSDDELAGVLAHEIAHIVSRAAQGKPPAVKTPAKGAANDGYSWREEYAADAKGFELARAAGFNPYGIFVAVDRIRLLTDKPKGSTSHPAGVERMARLSGAARQAGVFPQVREDGDKGVLFQGDWRLEIAKGTAGYKPLYRAWLLAGRLYMLVGEESPIAAGFRAEAADKRADVYYNEIHLFTVYPSDVPGSGAKNVMELAGRYVSGLALWADDVATPAK